MDFMFEDDADEVGSDVEAYCPKCKGDTTHVVISKYEDEIRRVQCNPCGDVHSFRKPRGEAEDDIPEPVAARKRALLKKPTWEEFFAKHGEKDAKPYEFREHYRENQIVKHPKFGKGFVSEIVSDSKVEITFQDARRVLVHNRKDIPGLPLAAEGDGTPTPAPKEPTKAAKGAAKDSAGKDGKDGKVATDKAPAADKASAAAKAAPGAPPAKMDKKPTTDKVPPPAPVKADKKPADKHDKPADRHDKPADRHDKPEKADKKAAAPPKAKVAAAKPVTTKASSRAAAPAPKKKVAVAGKRR